MTCVGGHIVLLKKMWLSRRHNFHSQLHYVCQKMQINFFYDIFPFVKESRGHDITLTRHISQHMNIHWKFCFSNNENIFRDMGKSSIISCIDFHINSKNFSPEKNLRYPAALFFKEHKIRLQCSLLCPGNFRQHLSQFFCVIFVAEILFNDLMHMHSFFPHTNNQ